MEELEHLTARLVDGRDDRHPLPAGKPGYPLHDMVRCSAVEAACWLVEEEKLGPGQNLHADAHPPLLTTTDALGNPSPYPRIPGTFQAHLPDRRLRSLSLLRRRHGVRQLELCRVVHSFSDGERCHQYVVLSHISLREEDLCRYYQDLAKKKKKGKGN